MRRLIVVSLVLLVSCTAAKNVSVTTPQAPVKPATIPPSIPPALCSGVPATIEREDGTLQCVSSASGDLDGDGAIDQFGMYVRLGPGAQVAELVGAAQMGDEREVREHVFDANEAAGGRDLVQVLGLADANGDSRDEVFLTLEGGASVRFGAIVALQGTRLIRVRSGSRPFLFGLSGSVRRGNGIECLSEKGTHKLILRSAYTDDEGETFSTTENEYRWSGTTSLVYRTRRSGSIAGDDDTRERFWQLRCGKLTVGALAR